MLYGRFPYDPDRHQIFVVHIRKTGGTSLHYLLAPAFPPPGGARVTGVPPPTIWTDESGLLGLHARVRRGLIALGRRIGDGLAVAAGRRLVTIGELPYAGGHHAFATIPRGRREVLPVTLVREPLARFVSDYRFMQGKRDRSRADCLDVSLYRRPLPAFAEAVLARPDLFRWNSQCLQIAPEGTAEAALAVIGRAFWLAAPMERMQDMADLIGRATGRDLGPVPHWRSTGGAGAAPLPGALARALSDRMAEDRALHAGVAEAFDRVARQASAITS